LSVSKGEVFVGVDIGSTTVKVAGIDSDGRLLGEPICLRLDAFDSQVRALQYSLNQYLISNRVTVAGLGTTGSGRELYKSLLGADLSHSEIFAHSQGLIYLCQMGQLPKGNGSKECIDRVGTIIEIGGQDSKVILFDESGTPSYFNMNTICSAGTGEFLKQLADEAGIRLDQLGQIALQSRHPANIDATCTVFSKRDFRHLTQKGVPLADRLMGACQAMVRNYLNTVVGCMGLPQPIFFQGGVAYNPAVHQALEKALSIRIYIPPFRDVVGALGMAVLAREHLINSTSPTGYQPDFLHNTVHFRLGYCHGCPNGCEVTQACMRRNSRKAIEVIDTLGGRCEGCQNEDNVRKQPIKRVELQVSVNTSEQNVRFDLLKISTKEWSTEGKLFLGLDGGSRGTKYALIRALSQDEVKIITAGSVDTSGDAVTALLSVLKTVEKAVPDKEDIRSVGCTGSAGELFYDILIREKNGCADINCTEILSHYAWAKYWKPQVGTVMDIGGNDAKIITVSENGLDFAMNDKCAAGTGAFLEAVAKRFHIPIEQYGRLALKSTNPASIGARCAVFGESDLVHKSRLGYNTHDLLMGLAYAITRTYLSDVGRGKPLKLPIVAQGGGFLNQALQYAFRKTLNLEENQFLVAEDARYTLCAGALGAALLAKNRYQEGYETSFKGFKEVFTRKYNTFSLSCRYSKCGRECRGLVVLLEDREPIAGYKAIDCPWGFFSGGRFMSSEQKAYILDTLKTGA
jgi:predicted CoA-substrate-specific enzyme activase